MRITTLFVVALMLLASNLLAADFVELKDVSGKHTIKVEINSVANGKVQVTDEKGKTSQYFLSIFDQDSRTLILNVVAELKDRQKPNDPMDPPNPFNNPYKDFSLVGNLFAVEHRSDQGGTYITCVAYSPDGKQIVAGTQATHRLKGGAVSSRRGTVGFWDANTGKLQGTIEHNSPVSSVAFSPDGKTIVGATYSKYNGYALNIWGANTGEVLQTLISSHYRFFALSPDGQQIAFVTRGATNGEPFGSQKYLLSIYGAPVKKE